MTGAWNDKGMMVSKIIGLCSGCFDILHPEHIEHFQRAKAQCDYLIVAIAADEVVNKGINRPYFKLEDRKKVLESIKFIDEIIVNINNSTVPIIEQYKPNIYFKGKKEYDKNGQLQNEINAVKKHGGEFKYTHETHKYSTSDILDSRKDLNVKGESYSDFIQDDEPIHRIKQSIPINQTFLILGEWIKDKYTYVDINGIANKNPIISTTYKDEKIYDGGADMIREHIKGFIDKKKISFIFGSNFIEKQRFINEDNKQKLFEVSNTIPSYLTEGIGLQAWGYKITDRDNLVICDFGHGLIEPNTFIWDYLKGKQHLMLSNQKINLMVQTNSMNYGYNTLRKYESLDGLHLNLISLDMREAALYCDKKNPEPEEVFSKIRDTFIVDHIMLTMGLNGIMMNSKKQVNIYETLHIPSIGKNYKTVDAIGCGDAAYALACITLAANPDPRVTLFCAALAGLMHSQVIGNEKAINYENFIENCRLFLK